jgi:gliding motility-associated-like protein
MRKYLIPVILLISLYSSAQTFTATTGLPATIPSSQDIPTCYNLNVSGVGTIGASKGLSQVCLTINHTSVQELEILLQAPDGTYIPLSIQNGGTGDNYTSTCFSATSTNPIKFNNAPFTGTFLPEGHLGAVNNGQNADGIWKLCILDGAGSAVGTLREWSITFNNNPAPAPPPFPNTCARTIPPSSDCANATSICDFNGVCGSTPLPALPATKKSWPDLDNKSCFGIQNNSFIKFIATSSTVSFSVWVPQSQTGFNNRTGGIQMLFFSTPTCGGTVTTHGCYDRIYPYHPNGKELINLIYATNLTPGNTYYLVIDGRNGDQCNFRIAANSGVSALNLSASSQNICLGETITLNASGGNGNYEWGANNPLVAGLSAAIGSTVNATPTTTGTIRYSLTSTVGLCGSTSSSIDINVNPLPAAPVFTITHPTCTTPTGTITITNVTGATYSINGTNYQTSNIFSGLTSGSYNVSIKNAGGCISPSSQAIINAAPSGTPSYVYSIIDPTCTNSTGGIVIQQPLGNNYEYNLNGGTYQSAPSFSNLPSGNYTTTVRDKTTGCVSPSSPFTVKAGPVVPAAPATTLVQPTCALPTGSISITTISGLTYSIDGNIYQSGNVFSGLNPGSYSVTAKNADGCVSPGTTAVINIAPNTPTGPAINITQPGCTTRSGTITITAVAGATYSIDGNTYQANNVFSGVNSGTYNVTVKNTSGCISPATSAVVNPAPGIPTAPIISITQPTCSNNTGTINITSQSGSTYSTDGNTYQTNNIFSGLNPGNYSVTIKNTAGCISSTTPAVLVQPTCITRNDLFVPNAFTPNGDSKNDILFVKGTSIKSMQFLIYNQWGEKVFESTRQDIGWDGTASGKSQPVGVYVYVLKAELLDGSTQQLKGSITLIR